MEFKNIESEVSRSYEFPGGTIITITNPLTLNVSASGGHRILDGAGVSHYIPPKWLHLSWMSKAGCSPFAF
jgi:hypothetical protein